KDETTLEDYLIEMGTENVRVRAMNDGHGMAGQPLQAFIKRVARWEKLMNLASKKKKRSRAVLEALLLEEELGEEALKDEAALKRIEERLKSYINLRAPDEAPLSTKLEEDPEHNCFKLICSTRHNGTGLRTVVDRGLLISPEYKEIKRLFDELSGGGYPP